MFRMESHHSDTSLNFSERELPGWDKLWNANYNSAGGLNLGENGSETDFPSAIGDKEVAAKAAVAFVVSSSRKGIVSLCADVANLMRAKRSLEDRIVQLSKENEALRLISDERESIVGSSVTQSKQLESTRDPHLVVRNNSIGSYHSASSVGQAPLDQLEEAGTEVEPDNSTTSQTNRQPNNNHIDFPLPTPGQRSFVPVTPARRASPRTDNEVIIHPVPSSEDASYSINDNFTLAEVHASATASPPPTRRWTRADARERRTPSLSSSERGSNRSLELSTVDEKQSRISISTMSQKLNKTVLVNNKLSEELNAARATIEKLQRQVRDFRGLCKNNNQDGASSNSQSVQKITSAADISLAQQKYAPDREFSKPGALSTCDICAEAQSTSRVNSGTAQSQFRHDDVTLFTSENMLVSLEDSVLTRNNQCGTVRYIGHLDGFAPTYLFVGLQLAEKVSGGLDGSFNCRKYFSCPKGCGIFIQAQDIVNVLSKKQASVLHKTKRNPAAVTATAALISAATSDSLASSSNSGSTGGFARRFRKVTSNIRHTHSHKNISLPEPIPERRQSGTETSTQSSIAAVISHGDYSHSSQSLEPDLPEGYV